MADASRHALSAGGKMLRALILLESCKAVGGDAEQAMLAAVGTEAGHLASLVHDDIMDQDGLRRGQPSVWKRYGANTAILVGDYFIFQAFYQLARCRDTGIPGDRVARTLGVVAQSCMDLCLGQDLEAVITGNLRAGVRAYMRVIEHKTAAFFRGAAESGAILGGGTVNQVGALAGYGRCLGMAFQIIDDVLSYRGDEAVMGKPVTSDLRNRRITLPILLAYRHADADGRRFLTALFPPAHTQPSETDPTAALVELRHLLAATHALERAEATALAFASRARQSLHTLPPTSSRDHLDLVLALATERAT
jgi:geranylgeranyl diphosphate synthase type I